MYSKEQESLIIGAILGDGYLTKPNKNSVYLSIQHSKYKFEYLDWLKVLFEENGFRVSEVYDVSRKYPFKRFDINIDYEYGIRLRHKFYPNNNRTITRHLLNKLDCRGLAIWFMDGGSKELHWRKDGTLSHFALEISTHSFSYKEHLIIQKYFKIVWGLDISINMNRGLFRIRINRDNSSKFLDIISEYVPECMSYKVTIPQKR